MKSGWITVGLCLVAAVVLIVRLLPHGRGARQASSSVPRQGHAAKAYMGLRSMVLDGTRANFGLGPGASPTEPFAVVMDWGDAQGATTVIAVADGSASVYHSNGTGSIGGGQTHEAIRNAALKAVELARAAQASMQRSTDFPVAGRGQVSFYVVTDAGVFGATAAQENLSGNRSPFSALGAAAQDIVAEYRRVEQKN
jgi:hypothetical protein